MTVPPIVFTWRDGTMTPMARFSRLAERWFTSGHAYRMMVMEEAEERSQRSHNAYFAAVHNAWQNLPEHLQLAFPTDDRLRKYALIKTNFCDVKHLTGDAKRHIAVDGYAIITHENGVTTVYTAKSQSYRTMGKAEFEASKKAVLDFLADMVGVTAEQLMKERAA